MKFFILFLRPSIACFESSSSGEWLFEFATDGKIGFDFLSLKLNFK